MRVVEIIEKLETKLISITKRRIKKQLQEEALIKLCKIYGKSLMNEKENWTRQLKILQESLSSDLKTVYFFHL